MLRMLGIGSEDSYARISSCHEHQTANLLEVRGNAPTTFPCSHVVNGTNGQALKDATQNSYMALDRPDLPRLLLRRKSKGPSQINWPADPDCLS